MALTLLTTEKASMTVGRDDGTGNVTPLGDQFHFSFATGKAGLQSSGGTFFVVAVAEGTDTLHVSSMDNSLTTDIPITVSADPSNPVPSLVVTFGAPEPK